MSKTPSIAVIPSGYKASKVYSVLPTNGDADLDFTRNCVATRINQNGLLEEVGIDVPRLDYSDGGCPSLLLEPQRTNLILDAITNEVSYSGTATIRVESPSGLIDAIVPIPTSLANRFEYVLSPSTFQTDDILTYSWYRKRITEPIGNYVGDLDITSLINLEEDGVTEQIESDVNGFDRFQARVKVVDGSLTSTFRAYFGALIGVGNQSVSYYGHQFELGSYATSLIYTSGTEVTRFKDEASKDNLESYINSSEGVLYAECSPFNNRDSASTISIGDGSSGLLNRLQIKFSTLNTITGFYKSSTSTPSITLTTGVVSNYGDMNKIAIIFNDSFIKIYINGVLSASSLGNYSFTPNTINILGFKIGSFENFYGKTKDIRVYNEALTDAELIELTTI